MLANQTAKHSLAAKRKLGAYYTPYDLCAILTDWAIVSASDKVIEPSFGQCNFLQTSKDRFTALGTLNPTEQIFGCDIDDNAFDFLKKTLEVFKDHQNFLQKDFMQIQPQIDWQLQFDSSVGNPPYISSHNLSENQRREYSKRWEELGLQISAKASLWAHFLIHAISFIKPNGRLAWVLPGSFLHADYSKNVRDYVNKNFQTSISIIMKQRFFIQEGTEEETIILLAKSKTTQDKNRPMCFANANNLKELQNIISIWDKSNRWDGKFVTAKPAYLLAMDSVLLYYDQLKKNEICNSFNKFINVNIGLVTGASSFFVLNETNRKKNKLPKNRMKYILASSSYAKGLFYSHDDLMESIDENKKTYLFNVKRTPKKQATAIAKYISSFPIDQIETNKTFQKRAIWHAPNDNFIPDAFVSPMNHIGPRMILNYAKINCTNTVYRVFFKEETDILQQKLFVISLQTSFSQLSAEFVGRRYGSGVLKHEPSEIGQISILLPKNTAEDKINHYFNKIDNALRNNDTVRATQLADEIILYPCENGQKLSKIFTNELLKARQRRYKTF